MKLNDYLPFIVIATAASLLTAHIMKTNEASSQKPIIISYPERDHERERAGGDDRYTMAPRPQRQWETKYERRISDSVIDPIATRGPPETYQQMGVLKGGDGKILPLYGRRVAPRSDYFNYYTRTDTYNPVQLPITFKRKDCQDNAGCTEISSGDDIHIVPTGETAKVTLYGFDGPRYE